MDIPELAPLQRVLLRLTGDRRLALILSVTVVCAAAWLSYYGAMRLTGDVPNPAQWAKSGARHGPWDDGPVLYWIPAAIFFYVVPVITAAIGLHAAITQRAPMMVTRGVGVGIVSMALALVILWVTVWLVD